VIKASVIEIINLV